MEKRSSPRAGKRCEGRGRESAAVRGTYRKNNTASSTKISTSEDGETKATLSRESLALGRLSTLDEVQEKNGGRDKREKGNDLLLEDAH